MKYKVKNIGILYEKGKDNWDIFQFKRTFEEKGVDVALFDVNQINDSYSEIRDVNTFNSKALDSLVHNGYELWMNRIYPSSAKQSTINKGLNIIAWLNKQEFKTINSLIACRADYDKFLSWQLMSEANVNTPYTRKLNEKDDISSVLTDFNLPLIIKKNTGGKGNGVSRIETRDKLRESLGKKDILSGKYLVQEFIPPNGDHDIRVGVVEGKSLISYGRTFVSKNGEQPWMASCNHGSQIIPYQASEEECQLAIDASQSIGASLNEVDIQITEKGPVVIENNPTPGYDKGEKHWVKLIVDHIVGSDKL